MPNVEEVRVVGDRKLIATIVSGSFRHQNEAERQEAVWSFIRSRLGSDELQNVEFIFTNTPEENAAA
jgi:acid stress-induced BolA-like protein IbaG/YrbA